MMRFKQLIIRSVKGNLQNYTLYIFALTFSVALYFSFVTLQYDPAMDEMKEMVNGPATIQIASLFLVLIVTVFLVYANSLFLKRRSKEMGVYQLVGMTKRDIWLVLSIENVILFLGSMFIGIFLGFSVSKLIMMMLFKVIDIEAVTTLGFRPEALVQTVYVFTLMYGLSLLINALFIRRQTIVALFVESSSMEDDRRRIGGWTISSGIVGMLLIIGGYILSSRLFTGDFSGNALFVAMFVILGSVTIGTYIFYKSSVRFFLHLNRKRKKGYVGVTDVVSLSAIMFRMKSNAFLLTVITLLSALAITLSSLSYIGYHSAEQTVKGMVPHHFSVFEAEEAEEFTKKLDENDIAYTMDDIPVIQVLVDMTDALVPGSYDHLDIRDDPRIGLSVIRASTAGVEDISRNEVILTKPNDALEAMLQIKESGYVTLLGEDKEISAAYSYVEEKPVLHMILTDGFPVVIVHDDLYESFANDLDPSIQREFSRYIGININQERRLDEANDIFHALNLAKWTGKWTAFESQLDIYMFQKQGMGLNIFVAGFLGLIFLMTSGCILYFKQMDESEEQKGQLMILRKLGFTEHDLLKGIRKKQLFNFGIPLILGLVHSYFAVRSGWFIFGMEMWTPTLVVMGIYTALYSIFGLLSVAHYKRIIRDAL